MLALVTTQAHDIDRFGSGWGGIEDLGLVASRLHMRPAWPVTALAGHALAGTLVKARRLSYLTMNNIRENLFFAIFYNALGVPLAAGVLYPAFGLLLNPMIAVAAMSFISVYVIANALRLRAVKL